MRPHAAISYRYKTIVLSVAFSCTIIFLSSLISRCHPGVYFPGFLIKCRILYYQLIAPLPPMTQTVLHTPLFHITVSSTVETSCWSDDEVQADVAVQRNGSDDGEQASELGKRQRCFELAPGDEDAKRVGENPGDSNDQEASESRKPRRRLERAVGGEDAKRRGVDSSGQQSGAENIPGPKRCAGDGTDQDGGASGVIFDDGLNQSRARKGPCVNGCVTSSQKSKNGRPVWKAMPSPSPWPGTPSGSTLCRKCYDRVSKMRRKSQP